MRELLSLWEATRVSTCCCVLPWHFWYLTWWRQSCDGLFCFTHTLKSTITNLLWDTVCNHPSVMLTENWCMTDVEFLWNNQREKKDHWFFSLFGFIWHAAEYLKGYNSRGTWITQSSGKGALSNKEWCSISAPPSLSIFSPPRIQCFLPTAVKNCCALMTWLTGKCIFKTQYSVYLNI